MSAWQAMPVLSARYVLQPINVRRTGWQIPLQTVVDFRYILTHVWLYAWRVWRHLACRAVKTKSLQDQVQAGNILLWTAMQAETV